MSAHAWRLILAHGRQQRGNEQGWRNAALAWALVLLPALAIMIWGSPRVRLFFGSGLLATLACIAWGALVVSLLEQNQPNAARLVPGHLRRLHEVLAMGWLVASVVVAGALMLMGLPWLAAWLAAAWGTALLGLLMRWPLGWVPVSLLPFVAMPLLRGVSLAELAALLQGRALLFMLLSVLTAVLLLAPVLGAGSAVHRASHARARRWREMARAGAGAQTWQGGGWFSLLTLGPYRHRLGRLSTRPGAQTLAARLMMGLGPATHWTAQVSGLLIFGGIFGLVCLVGLWIPVGYAEFMRAGSFGLTIGLMSALLGPVMGLGRTMTKTRAEQGLLVLLPGVPRGAAQNRLLARQWLLQYGLTWLLGLLVALGFVRFSDAPAELLLPFVLAFLLPLAMLWGDWSRLPAGGRGPMRVVLGGLATAGLGYALYRWQAVPLGLVIAAQLALALSLGVWRWRMQMSAPQALPVGRLA